MNFNEYKNSKGEIILYEGNPDLKKLEILSMQTGDIWHSSFEQGYKNAFSELVYQTATFYWYINDFDNLDQCVSWRINPNLFAVRKSTWEKLNGFDKDFESLQMQAFDFGHQCLRYFGGISFYVKDLFDSDIIDDVKISARDRHVFFRKNFKIDHAIYMNYRLGIWRISEWKILLYAKNNFKQRIYDSIIEPKELEDIIENPSVSYILPTMFRQDYALQLLNDLSNQNYKPTQVIVVDATPESIRDESLYSKNVYPFELKIIWQKTKGSCRARNEAVEFCNGEFIVFGDDDIRVPTNFIENHVKFLQTNNAGACNGLDIRADHHLNNLDDLQKKLLNFGPLRWRAGVTSCFSNANSCVKKEYVDKLIGNDVNFDGGYGEDADFGISLIKIGVVVLFNPFSTNLHLKPPSGGYRWWGDQSKIMGKKRKKQPWELDNPVGIVRPVPSPTVMYGIVKQFTPQQVLEYKYKHFSYYLFKGSKIGFIYRFLRIPYKNLQFKRSLFYANNLINLGIRTK